MKRALLLAGGGARGAYQVGMLRKLVLEQGLDFDIIRGVSVGALNGAFLAEAPTGAGSIDNLKAQVQKLTELWREEIRGNDSIYTKRFGGFAAFAVGADSLFKLGPLKKLINKHISVSELQASGRNFAVGTVSLVTGKYERFEPTAPNFLTKLLASASIPVVFPQVEIESEEKVLVDGGVRNISPVGGCLVEEPDEIWVLLTSKLIRKGRELPSSAAPENEFDDWDDSAFGTKVSGLDVLARTVELLTDEIYLDDLRGVIHSSTLRRKFRDLHESLDPSALSPEIAAKLDAVQKCLDSHQRKPVDVKIIAPREFYGDDNSAIEFDPDLIEQAIHHGECVAGDENCWVWPPVEGDPPCPCDD